MLFCVVVVVWCFFLWCCCFVLLFCGVVVVVVFVIVIVIVVAAAHPVFGVLFELVEVKVDAEDVLGLLEGGVGVFDLVLLLGGDRLTFFVHDEIVRVRLVLRVSPVFGVSAEKNREAGGWSVEASRGGGVGIRRRSRDTEKGGRE